MSEEKRFHIETLNSAKIYSGVEYSNHEIDYGITTDGGNADSMQADGNRVSYVPGTSYEIVGNKITEKEPAKIIIAENGNIHLEAENGDIIIKARNIRIVAEDGSGEITLNSGKIIDLRAPLLKENATNITVAASGNIETISGTKSDNSQITNQAGSIIDATQGSFLGKIFSGFDTVKKFFRDCLS